jgi:tetratricopeptide (TPR) repeat protein
MNPRGVGLVCLACLGCHAVVAFAPLGRDSEPPAQRPAEPAPSGARQWSQGQEALGAGNAKQAVALYRQSLEVQPSLKQNHLSLAAAYLAQGDEPRACDQLRQFLDAQPDHRNARFYYAELLCKLGQATEAREQFEHTIAVCQEEVPVDARHLLHCHGRLLKLAEAADDEYEVCLQRGIGMFWLAQARAKLGEPAGDLPVEALLCRAAGSLSAAHELRPEEARPCWYLHRIWQQLAQQHQAQHWLNETQNAATFSTLTPSEQRSLQIAYRSNDFKCTSSAR